MAISLTQLYTPASADEIRDDFLTDVRLEARKHADPEEVDRIVRPGTDWYILATAMGNLGLLQYSNIAKAAANANLLSATGAALDSFREALGLPEIPPSPASGRIVVSVSPPGTLVNFNNHEFTLPNGKRGRVNGQHIGIGDQGQVPIITIDTGSDCNLEAGKIVRFISPPPNVAAEAKVSVDFPFVGGTDEETDERKRDRILNRMSNVPAGGNWGYCIEQALNALATVQYAFVYPALGGPASAKVVLAKDIDPDNYDFSRALGTPAVELVRNALHAVMPDEMEIVVQSVGETYTDDAMYMKLPNSISAGGNGLGWVDSTPWPEFIAAPAPAISAISSDGLTITVNAATAVAPTTQTNISWWSSVDQAFQSRSVTAVAGMAGAWVLTLDQPLRDHNNNIAQVGDYISPASVNIVQYGNSWRTSARRLGPAENTTDVNRLPRSLRRPFADEDWFSNLSVKQLIEVSANHDEIADISWAQRTPSTPTVPGSVDTAPNVLRPRHFGIYKL